VAAAARLLAALDPSASRIAVVGLAKNTGKTTTVNALLAALHDAGRAVGCISVGVDGEAADAIHGTPKPPVRLAAGTLVATASRVLVHATAAHSVVEATGIHTQLGELVIARATSDGDVMLAGVRHRADVRTLSLRLRAHGARTLVIDGAFDRWAAADPDTADSIIVCTGLAAGVTAADAATRAGALIRILTLPLAAAAEAPPAALADHAALRRGDHWERAPWRSLLVAAPPRAAAAEFDTVYVPGAITARGLDIAAALLSPGGALLARDPTRVQVDDDALRRFLRTRSIRVLRRVRVAAITVNPTAPGASPVEARALVEAVAAAIDRTAPVLDVVAGAYCPGAA
jgi:hypothetical protein